MENIHATCIVLNNRGILLTGPSGSGKSDLALRMIFEKGAFLVADDRTNICNGEGRPTASCPESIKGLLEVRGIGIIKCPAVDTADIYLVAEMVETASAIERLPSPESVIISGHPVKKIKLYPFELSAVHKLALACDEKTEAC